MFENPDIVHVEGSVDPVRDINVINTELILADYEQCEKALENQKEKTRTNDKDEVKKQTVIERCLVSWRRKSTSFNQIIRLRKISSKRIQFLNIKEGYLCLQCK